MDTYTPLRSKWFSDGAFTYITKRFLSHFLWKFIQLTSISFMTHFSANERPFKKPAVPLWQRISLHFSSLKARAYNLRNVFRNAVSKWMETVRLNYSWLTLTSVSIQRRRAALSQPSFALSRFKKSCSTVFLIFYSSCARGNSRGSLCKECILEMCFNGCDCSGGLNDVEVVNDN